MEKRTVPQTLVDRFPALRKLATQDATRQIPFIQQLSATECGAACLAMVLASHGKHVPLSDVRDMTGVNARRRVCPGTFAGGAVVWLAWPRRAP